MKKTGIAILTAFILTIVGITGLNIPGVYASTQLNLWDCYPYVYTSYISGVNTYGEGRPQNRILKHSGGKSVILSLDSSNILHLHVISSVGILEADTILLGHSGVQIHPCGGGVVVELSGTEVLVFTQMVYSTAIYMECVVYNINTFNQVLTEGAFGSLSGAAAGGRTTNAVYDSGKWYVLCSYQSYSSGAKYAYASYTVSGGAVAIGTAQSGYFGNESYIFMNVNSPGKIYCVISSGGAPSLLELTISGGTYITLMTGGLSTVTPVNPTTPYAYYIDVTFNDGGIITESTHYYLYNSWCYSYVSGGLMYTKTVFWEADFNNTISSGTLLSQNTIVDDRVDSSGTTVTTPGFQWSFSHNLGLTLEIETYYRDAYAGKYISKVALHITDLTTMPTSFDTTTVSKGMDGIDFTLLDNTGDYLFAKNPAWNISYYEKDNTHSYIYVGESINSINFSSTITYNPLDVPLLTGKDYDFTYTVYLNGILDILGTDPYKIYVDGIERDSGTVPISGAVTLRLRVLSSGTHGFRIMVYNPSTYISPTTYYTFSTSTVIPPVTPEVLIVNLNQLWYVIPPLMCILVPGILIAGLFNNSGGAGLGFFVGAFIGTFAGAWGGVLPQSSIYIMGFLLCVVAYWAFTNKGSGGSI